MAFSSKDIVQEVLEEGRYEHLQPGLTLQTKYRFLVLGQKTNEEEYDSPRKVLSLSRILLEGAKEEWILELSNRQILNEILSGQTSRVDEETVASLREIKIPLLEQLGISPSDIYTLPKQEFREKFRLS